MLLTIDAGNTNVVFALYEGFEQRAIWRCSTDARRTADEYAVWLTHLMNLQGLKQKDVTSAVIASVVPGATFNLKRLCSDHFGCNARVVGETGVNLGIQVLVDQPGQVGADRLVNAIAAADTYGGPLIVVDFGTATTFDVVDNSGNYIGGVIAPGINLSMEALHRAAAMLPRIDIVQPSRVIGKSTIPAMQSGLYWGYIGLIEGLVARIQEEFGAPMKVVATGGLAVLFSKATSVIGHIDSDLTLRGLCLIHQRNTV